MKIKHLIITRFLSTDFGGVYKNDIFDPNFIHYHETLLKNNFFKTLENQSNKNFEIVIIIHNDVDMESLSEIQNINTPIKYHIVRRKDIDDFLYSFDHTEYDYIILSKFDDDDFIRRDVVDNIQNKCMQLRDVPLHVYGFNHGYAAFENNDDVKEFDSRFTEGHFSVMQSFIFNMKFTKNIFDIYTVKHTEVMDKVKEFYNDNNLLFDKDKSISWFDDRCFIWYRHQSTGTDKKGTKPVINERFLSRPNVIINKKDYGWS